MKYYIKTFGCQMNIADSNYMEGCFRNLGMTQVQDKALADVILVNTCTVRDHAEHTAMSYIGRLKPFKKKKPELKVILAGCAAERVGEHIKKRFPIIDLVVGAKNIEAFPELFDTLLEKARSFAIRLRSGTQDDRHVKPARAQELKSSRAPHSVCGYVTIMRGCENFCSYCIVPYVRGKEISRGLNDIIQEVKALAEAGVKDVTLLGQNVNSYRGLAELRNQNLDKKHKQKTLDFADLLGEVNKIKGIERIRFMTSHPKDLSAKLIDAVASLDKVCSYIHLPLQSGSDKILKAMNRKYTAADYFKIIKAIKHKIPDITLTTDVMVGFPGETTKEFNGTLKMIDKAGYDFLFAFKYSPRPGTKACELKDNVSTKTKEARLAKILAKVSEMSLRKNRALVGKLQEVLVEGKADGKYFGRTEGNKKVYFHSKKERIGSLVQVKIEEARFNSLIGTKPG